MVYSSFIIFIFSLSLYSLPLFWLRSSGFFSRVFIIQDFIENISLEISSLDNNNGILIYAQPFPIDTLEFLLFSINIFTGKSVPFIVINSVFNIPIIKYLHI